jgi:hypothetical protein
VIADMRLVCQKAAGTVFATAMRSGQAGLSPGRACGYGVEVKGSQGEVMGSRMKLFGHALHPILIVFPLGVLARSVIFAIAYWATGKPRLSDVAY